MCFAKLAWDQEVYSSQNNKARVWASWFCVLFSAPKVFKLGQRRRTLTHEKPHYQLRNRAAHKSGSTRTDEPLGKRGRDGGERDWSESDPLLLSEAAAIDPLGRAGQGRDPVFPFRHGRKPPSAPSLAGGRCPIRGGRTLEHAGEGCAHWDARSIQRRRELARKGQMKQENSLPGGGHKCEAEKNTGAW